MRRSKGTVYRKSKGRGEKKRGFYRARYTNENGDACDHTIVLDNGIKVLDKGVAVAWLDQRLKLIERRVAGVIDKDVENAVLPIRTALAGYVRWMHTNPSPRTGRPYGRKYIRQSLGFNKWIVGKTDMARVADFNERRIEAALAVKSCEGVSVRTVNVYRSVAHHFGWWMSRKSRLLQVNPVEAITVRKGETVKQRRALSVAEAYRLLAVSGRRRLFYSVQLWTGLRVSEVGALQWRDLVFDDRPCIRLRAETTKAKRADEIPLHADLATMLSDARPSFAEPTDRVFATIPTRRTLVGGKVGNSKRDGTVLMQTGDLERAGIDAVNAQGRSVDRHSLRTTFGTWLAIYGVTPDARRILMRHAATTVTDRHYLDVTLLDLWKEIAKLPVIQWETETLKDTGTVSQGSQTGSTLGSTCARPHRV